MLYYRGGNAYIYRAMAHVTKSKLLQDALAYPPRLLRADRAAAYLAMSRATFLNLVEQGALPKPVRLRGVVAWDRAKLDSFVDALEHEPPSSRRNTMDEAMGITTEE